MTSSITADSPSIEPSQISFQLCSGCRTSELSHQLVDIWEHACFLHNHSEWQDAVEIFHGLSEAIGDAKERKYSLLNKGLIQARLGDIDEAIETLRQSLVMDEQCALTYYLLGNAENERGDIIQAQACFEICLEKMKGHDIDMTDVGLPFRLSIAAVRHNATTAWSTLTRKGAAAAMGTSMVGLKYPPVNCLFDAPPRPTDPQAAATARPRLTASSWRSSILSNRQNALSLALPSRQPSIAHTRQLKPEPLQVPSTKIRQRRHTSPSSPSVENATHSLTALRSHGTPPQTPLKAKPLPEECIDQATSTSAISPSEVQSTSTLVSPNSAKHSSWTRRPSTPYVPRDAKVEYISTKPLAKFIRMSGPEHADFAKYLLRDESSSPSQRRRDVLDDRTPAGERDFQRPPVTLVHEHATTEPLNKSEVQYRIHRPQHSRTLSVPGLKSPAVPMFGQVLSEEPVQVEAFKRTSAPVSLVASSVYSCDEEVLESSSSESTTPTEEDRGRRGSDNTERQRLQAFARHPRHPFANLHTAASSTSNLFHDTSSEMRVQLARDAAMRLLEGAPGPIPAPNRAESRRSIKRSSLRKALPNQPEDSVEQFTATPSTMQSDAILRLGSPDARH